MDNDSWSYPHLSFAWYVSTLSSCFSPGRGAGPFFELFGGG